MSSVNLSDRTGYRRLIQIIANRANVRTELDRQNLLDRTGLSAFGTRLHPGTSADAFSQELVRELQEYGTLADTGQPALVSLLRELRELSRGHEDDAAFLNGLLAPYPDASTVSQDRSEQRLPERSADLVTDRSADLVRILFLAANPRQTEALKVRQEADTIRARVSEGDQAPAIRIETEFAINRMAFSEALLKHRPRIVHFAGHGLSGGGIALEDDLGGLQVLSAEVLADLLGIFKDHVRCVVLNACWSALQAKAIADHIDVVVGMARPVGDEAAIRFAAGFYQAIGFGESVQTAFELGRNAMASGGRSGGSGGGRERDLDVGQGAVQAGAPGGNVPDLPQIVTRAGVDAAAVYLAGNAR